MVSLDDFTQILFTEEVLQERVRSLARQIAEDYHGKTLIVLTVMKGADNFSRDLRREINRYDVATYGNVTVDLVPDMVIMSMYPHPDRPKEVPDRILGLSPDIQYEGSEVLIVEDIVDRGLTIKHLKEEVLKRHPKSIRLCSLLSKPSKRRVDTPIDYLGFEVEDHFVVGYGLDFEEHYSDIPFIGILKPEIYVKN